MVMKKSIIIGVGVALALVVAVLFWRHFEPSSEAKIRNQIIGSWMVKGPAKGVWHFVSDGSYYLSLPSLGPTGFGGTWQVTNGVLLIHETIRPAGVKLPQGVQQLPKPWRIIYMDDTQLVCSAYGQTNIWIRQ